MQGISFDFFFFLLAGKRSVTPWFFFLNMPMQTQHAFKAIVYNL